jgi:hypothetical protein
MTCCGKTIKKVLNISQGQISALAEKLFDIEIMKCDRYDLRFKICSGCNKRTYLTKAEYAEWLIKNGKDVAVNFTELENLPALPKKELVLGTLMFCRICKCYLDAKCRVDTEKCPMGRWK